ncbi:MAG: hypothetical protein LBK53_06710 [Heliobacteriaceae bacterium]|jgi:hypothetical protein|nr:hypothetical protein [Heliobacteriaceae bacterium]
MGMAASQARFLGLTARKTNVEYEGQQINQQRTALANQSANYYNDMLGMSVPVPPSVDNYTKTVYTFEDGALTNTITAMIADSANKGKYTISYLKQWVDDFSPVSAASGIVTHTGSNKATDTIDKFRVGAQVLRELGAAITIPYTGNDEYLKTLTDDEINKLIEEEKAYKNLLDQKYNSPADGWGVRYIKDSSTGKQVPYFYKLADLRSTNTEYDSSGNSKSHIPCYTIGSEKKTEEVKAVKNCVIEQDSTGRIIKLSIPINGDANNTITYALTTNTITDQGAYNDAMNQYEFAKHQYDQTIQEINSKIAIIQSEDKNLELRLKQLDTEQNAISTEMDAVSKVIEKNVEATFKTFG